MRNEKCITTGISEDTQSAYEFMGGVGGSETLEPKRCRMKQGGYDLNHI